MDEAAEETTNESIENVESSESNANDEVNCESNDESNTETSQEEKSNSRRWTPKSKYRRLNKAQLKQSINLFYNLSDLPVTKDMKSLLNKGLNFYPTPQKVNVTQLSADKVYQNLTKGERESM